VTRRLPERTLIGSVAVPDIVLAHWVSDPDRVTSGVPTAAGSWSVRRAMAHPTDDSSRDIPKAGPGAVGFVSQPGIIFGPHQRGSGQHSRIRRQRL
jgi:hypothetical protein